MPSYESGRSPCSEILLDRLGALETLDGRLVRLGRPGRVVEEPDPGVEVGGIREPSACIEMSVFARNGPEKAAIAVAEGALTVGCEEPSGGDGRRERVRFDLQDGRSARA